ncbi:hypothetical protein G9A89_011232 [Geosiphon pyriformis]|nr:hypothetical protein G9A89_011232 [Geosiphon pyriformis]
MAYVPIAKLEKFIGEKNNAQVWLNNVEKTIVANEWNDTKAMQAILYFFQNTADLWYQSLVNKSQDFNAFKIEFLRYFSNNNSINRLVNIFTTIKQEENKAVTTYLGCFHRNLHQIQAINANYFTMTQILNQFIHRLCSNILQWICSMHPINLQAAVTNSRDFEVTELEANHTQAINLAMNRSSELDTKLKQFNLLTYNAAVTLSTTSISNTNLLTNNTSNLSTAATTHLLVAVSDNLLAPTNSNTATEFTSKWNPKAKIDSTKLEINLGTKYAQNPNSQNYLSLLVTPENTQPNNPETNQHQILTSNILPATITENKLLNAIFPFELKEPSTMLLFSGAALKKKPITAMYTDAKVDGHFIKLILNINCAASARIITADGATKTPIGKIDDFPFEVNGIIIPIKVLVMKATQYQALVRNNWLSKTNAILDWMTQKLQLSQNGQHTCVPATCSHFKTTNSTTPLIKFEEEEKKPTWKAYQVSWADTEHNELLPVFLWDDNSKGKLRRTYLEC